SGHGPGAGRGAGGVRQSVAALGAVAHVQRPVAWVRRVALNLATSRWRQVRAFRRFASRYREEHVDGPTPDRVALASALSMLPANQRRVVIQFYLADMTVAQIAREDGIPDGTVKSWLYQGRAALAASLEESRVEAPDA